MTIEIERKWRVRELPEFVRRCKHNVIRQGYLYNADGRSLRIRAARGYERSGFITFKSPSIFKYAVEEVEMAIPLEDAEDILKTCTKVIEKTRYYIHNTGMLTIEVDVFGGSLAGLIIAEVEFPSPETYFVQPLWFDEEVTDNPQYRNASLIELA